MTSRAAKRQKSMSDAPMFPKRLAGKRVAIFIDYAFEDLEVTFPKIRLEEEGCAVVVVGGHAAGQKYTGKYGYPVKSDLCIDDFDASAVDGLVLPGGFAPDYMRRNQKMLAAIAACCAAGKPCAAVCHGPWMFCSARDAKGAPVCKGRTCTSFVAIKDDVINAGAEWVDAPVVVDGPLISARTPNDLVPFVQALIRELMPISVPTSRSSVA
mmetsp:Transcript_22174/g.66578  ORF Transcript_22174/g.66578 Transcript_22174/m.66578 type:complete len:211 (-) Transcript_22174:25-657(-)